MVNETEIDIKGLKHEIAHNDGSTLYVDVRSPEECYAEYIQGFVNIPLNGLAEQEAGLSRFSRFVVLCKSGIRAKQGASAIKNLLPSADVGYIKGGLDRLASNGKSEIASAGKALPIIRQVQIVAGSAVILTSILAFMQPWIFLVVAGIGAGLLLAGVTGKCAVASMMQAMPWNKNLPKRAQAFVQREMAFSR